MRYSILAFIAGAAAAPFASTGGAALCPTGLFSNPQCCATDVLGVVGLNCAVPATTPTSTTDFIAGCAAAGQQAKCCVIPVADQGVLCQDVSPGAGTPDDGTPGDGTPGDGTPGDGTPGDGTPGDGTPGDGTPGDGTPGGDSPTPSPEPSKCPKY